MLYCLVFAVVGTQNPLVLSTLVHLPDMFLQQVLVAVPLLADVTDVLLGHVVLKVDEELLGS